jgi:hypothetical protein
MAERSRTNGLNGARARSYPERRDEIASADDDPASDDSEEVLRYRRFFASHDLSGRPRARPDPARG